MKILILLTLLITLISCSGKKMGETTTSIKLINSALMSGATPLNAGIMVYGIKSDNSQVFAIKANSGDEDVALNLPNGSWNFYAIGWSGAAPLSGVARCGQSLGVSLAGSEVGVNLSMSANGCVDPIFSKSYVGRPAGVDVPGTFYPLKVSNCIDLVSDITTKADVSYSAYCAPEKKGLIRSYEVILADFLPSAPNAVAPNLPLKSNCVNIGAIPTPVEATDLQIPFGNGTLPLYTIIKGYYGEDCQKGELGVEEHHFPKGLGNIDNTLASRKVFTGYDSATPKASLYLKADQAGYCARPVGALSFAAQLSELGVTTSSAADPIRVCNASQFYALAGTTYLNYGIRLLANINLFTLYGNGTVEEATPFEMIGEDCNSSVCPTPTSLVFTGAFFGEGHKVSGLTIEKSFPTSSAPTYIGMFRKIASGGKVRDLRLVLPEVKATSSTGTPMYAGIVAGESSGEISNVEIIHGNVEAEKGDMVGGVVGFMQAGSGFLSNVKFTKGHVRGRDYVGGLVGKMNGTGSPQPAIKRSLFQGEVSGNSTSSTAQYTGGIVGAANSSGENLLEVAFHGKVEGATYLGGLVGFNSTGTIKDSYATGIVKAYSPSSNYIGGLVGAFGAAPNLTSSFFAHGSIISPTPANTGKISGGSSGPSCGTGTFSSSQGAFSQGCTNSITVADENDLHASATYNGTDFPTAIWVHDDPGYDIPRLSFEEVRPCHGKFAATTGLGTDANPLTICTPSQFSSIASYPEKSHILLDDISFEFSAASTNSLIDNVLVGRLNGNHHTISGIKITVPSSINNPIGVFTSTAPGSFIENLTIEGLKVNTMSGIATSQQYVGGLVGSHGGTIQNVSVSGIVDGPNDPDVAIGGIAGRTTTNGKIFYTQSSVQTTGFSNIGNVVGINEGTIKWTQSYGPVFASVNGGFNAGGIAGENLGTISESYAHANLNLMGAMKFNKVGGLVGKNSGLIENSYALAEITNTVGAMSPSVDLCLFYGVTPYSDGSTTFIEHYSGVADDATCTSNSGFWINFGADLLPINQFVGGLVGENLGSITTSYASFKFSMTPPTFAALPYWGTLVGKNSGTMTNAISIDLIQGGVTPIAQTNSSAIFTTGSFDIADFEGQSFSITDTRSPHGTNPLSLTPWILEDGERPKLQRAESNDDYPMSYYINLITGV